MSELVETVVQAVREAGAKLRDSGVAPEALAVFVPERRKLLIRRKPTMLPLGHVWRLGTLMIGADEGAPPALYVVGKATRSAPRLHPGNQSISREERRDVAAAALNGGYAEGTPVNYDAVQINLAETALTALAPELPLGLVDGQLRVRWRAGAPLDGAQTFEAYLRERSDLLANPPQGAS
ncbi:MULTISPECIES: hypothetical protein [Leucobacter]|uniref:hypothetical protein n=1 Tax=Leucobacter TaxID=55968 RepID=UPI0021068A60|nr:hypothetical protein [Leucobacter aridicollis]